MFKINLNFYRRCYLIVLLMASSIDVLAIETEVSVPKGLQDVVTLINSTNVDVKSIDNDLKIISQKIADDASTKDKYIHYYFQAKAADRLGRINSRIDFLNQTLEYAEKSTQQEFQVAIELVAAEFQVGNSQKAIARLENLHERVPSQYSGVLTTFYSSLSQAYAAIGDYENAEKHLKNSRSMLISLRRSMNYLRFGYGWERNYFQAEGELAFQRGRFAEAEVSFKKAIEIFEPGVRNLEKTINAGNDSQFAPGLGPDERVSGNINTPKEALEGLYIKLSDTLLKLRKVNESEYYSREALKRALARTGRHSVATSKALRQLAVVMLARERNKDAIYLLNESLTGLKNSGVTAESVLLAITQKTMASAMVANEDFANALKIYELLDTTIANYPQTGQFVDVITPDRIFVLIKLKELSQAEKMARQLMVRTEARTGKLSREMTQAKLLLSVTLAEQRKDEEARNLFASSIKQLIEEEREVTADNDGISSKEKKFLESYVESYLELLLRAYERQPGSELVQQAFELGDLARSSSVQRALSASTARANISDPRLLKLVRQEQDQNQQIVFLSRFIKELEMQPASEQLPKIQAKMKEDIQQLRKEAKQTAHLIALDFPEYAELISPRPITLEKIRKQLKSNETLVTWFVGSKSTYIWAVNQGAEPLFKSVPTGRNDMRKSIARLRQSLDPGVATIEDIPAFDFTVANQLYDILFKPVQSALTGKETLVLVPHDEIGQLPLGVLTTAPFRLKDAAENTFANYRDAPWLISKYAIVSAPSVTALSALRGLPEPRKGRLDFVGFGDPLFSVEQAQLFDKKTTLAQRASNDMASRGVPLRLRNSPSTAGVSSAEVSLLPRLPDTNEEILEIAKVFDVSPERDIFLQRRANLDEVLKADLSNRKVVMFSTHGLIPGELDGLTQPALALTNPEVRQEKGDGLLKVDTILTLKLDADWVVLSACNTAAGEGEGSEALSGLGRAFFFAGARAILVSSWPVDSEASRKLMTDLFKRYTETKNKPLALQQASLQLMRHGVPDDVKSRYTYAHPLFWAPFTMVGN